MKRITKNGIQIAIIVLMIACIAAPYCFVEFQNSGKQESSSEQQMQKPQEDSHGDMQKPGENSQGAPEKPCKNPRRASKIL
ncbi:MAG: hypothetical protein MJ189_05460, partial [Coriobacteriales bacterium]|nr:hypothetical protein [Coriobacteriales bacterium]